MGNPTLESPTENVRGWHRRVDAVSARVAVISSAIGIFLYKSLEHPARSLCDGLADFYYARPGGVCASIDTIQLPSVGSHRDGPRKPPLFASGGVERVCRRR